MVVLFARSARRNSGRKLLAAASCLLWSCGYDWDGVDPRLGGGSVVGAGHGGEAAITKVAGAAGAAQLSSAGTSGAATSAGASAAAGTDLGGQAGVGGDVAHAGVGGEAGRALPLGGAAAGQVSTAGQSGSTAESGSGGQVGSAGAAALAGSAGAAGLAAPGGSGGATGSAGQGGTEIGGAAGSGGGSAGSAGGVDGQAGSAGAGGDGGVCPSGQVLCGATCVSTQSNVDHCGQCNNACSDSEICRAGDCVVPCSAAGLSVLFVVRDDPLSEGDPGAYDLLTTLGFANISLVTTGDLNRFQMIPAGLEAGMDLVVVSSTPRSGNIGDRFTNSVVPVLTWEYRLYDVLGIATNNDPEDNATTIDVVDPLHPLAAGLSGVTTVFTAPGPLGWGQATASAAVVATSEVDPARATLFAVEAGDPLENGTAAPSRRVGLFLGNLGAGVLTPEGRRLSLVALCWAAGLPPY